MLSIIIVNYNVKYFLEQCLYSVEKAAAGIDTEVIVVDNNSSDESVAYLQKKFPRVKLVANTENRGYGTANNQGWQMAQGEYILFLNPDTLLSEDCLQRSLSILAQQDTVGALGIHMLDGSGRFLEESKRGFPSPRVSFFKLSGLIKIFPHSKTIARYYMGHLPEKENNEIDVLTGAFMMVKNSVLKKTGGFDERFFMYGEDIDLSYRIKQAGYSNFYLADSSIIHFKGESTRKDFRYTRLFYKAMRIFVEKHYGKESRFFSLLVQLAIGVRGVIAYIGQLFRRRQPLQLPVKTIRSIIVGKAEETIPVMDELKRQRIKRTMMAVESLEEVPAAMSLQKTNEIIFCAGAIGYRDIIKYIEQAKPGIDYKFFAAGSKTIVGSISKNNSGETIVFGEG